MDLKIENSYYPYLEQCYFYVVVANFAISTIIFPYMTYIVIKKSTKPMGEYKLLILNQLFWSYAFNVILTLWLPVPILPFTIAYPIGLAKLFPSNSFYYCFFAFVLCAIGTGHSIFVSFLYRIVKLKSHSTVAKFYAIKWLIFPARAITLTGSLTIFMVPLIMENTGLEALKNAIMTDAPFMKFFFETSKFIGIGGYHLNVGNGWIKVFFIEMSCLCVLLFLSILLIHTFFIWNMQKFRLHVSPTTFRLHQMLYRALTIQLAVVTIELFTPLTIYFLLYYFQISNGSFYAIFLITLTSFYTNCNFVVVCYYIKPYRVYVLKKVAKVLGYFGCEKAMIVSFSLSKSTQHGYNVNTIH